MCLQCVLLRGYAFEKKPLIIPNSSDFKGYAFEKKPLIIPNSSDFKSLLKSKSNAISFSIEMETFSMIRIKACANP